jgi:hypothetical protein
MGSSRVRTKTQMCSKCSEGLEHLRGTGIKMPKEVLASLPGRQANKRKADSTPEEWEQHRLFRRHYERWYRDASSNLREYQIEYHKNYKLNHPELLQEYSKLNYQQDKERYYEGERRRRAMEADVYSERYSKNDVLSKWGTDCHMCSGPIDLDAPAHASQALADEWRDGLHLDHIIPIAIGGPDILENVKPAHAKCNLGRPKNFSDVEALSSTLDVKVLNLVNVEFQNRPRKRGRKLMD